MNTYLVVRLTAGLCRDVGQAKKLPTYLPWAHMHQHLATLLKYFGLVGGITRQQAGMLPN